MFVLLLQSRVQVVHFDAQLVVSVSLSLVAVMELENALMAVALVLKMTQCILMYPTVEIQSKFRDI